MLPLPCLSIPIALPDSPEHNIKDMVVTGEFLPGEVEAAYPMGDNGTFIQFKSGQVLYSTWTFEEYQKQKQGYWNKILEIVKKGQHNNRLISIPK